MAKAQNYMRQVNRNPPCVTREVYSTKGTSHWGTEEHRPWEENRPKIREKVANFDVFTLFRRCFRVLREVN